MLFYIKFCTKHNVNIFLFGKLLRPEMIYFGKFLLRSVIPVHLFVKTNYQCHNFLLLINFRPQKNIFDRGVFLFLFLFLF